jgi:hypothetical protein
MPVVPVVYDLLPQAPVEMLVSGDEYHWASPVTNHIWVVNPEHGALPDVAYALMRIQSRVETSESALFRLAAYDSGPSNPIPLAWLRNSHPGEGRISSDGVYFEAGLRQILALNQYKQLGWQMAGDSTHPVTIFDVRLEIGWRVA